MIQESWGKGVYSFLFFSFFTIFFLVYNLVTSMMELLDSLVILQVDCQKHRFWINIKLFFKSKCQINFFFKTPIGKLILVKEMNYIYEIAQGFKDVFVSFYKKTLSEKWIMLGCKHDWMINSLFSLKLWKRSSTTKNLWQHLGLWILAW